MIHEMQNPARVRRCRASGAFCFCTEHTENNPEPLEMQGDSVWSPADLRLATGGPSECEIELLDCTPAASDPQMHALLWGICVRDMAGLHVDQIVFVHNNRFELARRARDASSAVIAVIFMARDDLGNPLDLAAWEPETGRLALWLGRVSMLGQDNLYSWRIGEPLTVHETALEWLQAGRDGVFVIDPQGASPLLRMVEPLGVRRPEFGRRMRESMTIRAPRIVVAAAIAGAAA
jgi:hypothetical protein